MGLLSKWTDGERQAPEPLEGPVVGTIITGTALWAVLFLGQLPFYGWFEEGGHTWWLWTCAAGAALGLLGIWIVRRREAVLKRQEPDRSRDGESTAHSPADGPAGGPADDTADDLADGSAGATAKHTEARTGTQDELGRR